jgi:5-methylthioadenosine/S-adenosylhomocysteine deaminase
LLKGGGMGGDRPPADTTVIRNADWIVAWSKARSDHEYFQQADLAFAGDRILFVGRAYDGDTAREIDGRNRMVVPGFVDIHSHPSREPLNKGLMEERGSPQFAGSSLYEFMDLLQPDDETTRAARLFAIAELLKSGVTTLVDFAVPGTGWLEDMAASGIRAYLAPTYRSARWRMPSSHSVAYVWDEAAGEAAMDQAIDIIDRAVSHPSGRLSGIVAPAQADTCTEGLMVRSLEAARKRNLPIQTHAAQSVVEFRQIMARYGMTPIGWLDSIGFLHAGATIAHAVYVDEHPWIRWHHAEDLDRLARSGATVAHCPTVFARRGVLLHDFGKYRGRGIKLALGTDTFPHNFIDEMRWAAVLSKVSAGNVAATKLRDILDAATVGGAGALLRDDIGRLEAGAKADFSIVDLAHPAMQPLRDPLASLVFSGLERAISDVFVDGRQVVADGVVVTIDLDAAIKILNRGQAEAMALAPVRDYAHRPLQAIFPMTLDFAT